MDRPQLQWLQCQKVDRIVHRAAGSGAAARQHALSGGEDYALLFAGPPQMELAGIEIGSCVAGQGMFECTDAGRVRLDPAGYEHFRT